MDPAGSTVRGCRGTVFLTGDRMRTELTITHSDMLLSFVVYPVTMAPKFGIPINMREITHGEGEQQPVRRGEGRDSVAANNYRLEMFHSFTGGPKKFLPSVFADSVSGVLAEVLTGRDSLVVCTCLQWAHAWVEMFGLLGRGRRQNGRLSDIGL